MPARADHGRGWPTRSDPTQEGRDEERSARVAAVVPRVRSRQRGEHTGGDSRHPQGRQRVVEGMAADPRRRDVPGEAGKLDRGVRGNGGGVRRGASPN